MEVDSKVNILLVDDQPGKLLSYEVMLADLNENLIKVESAKEALHHLLKTDIAVVLVDVCMPDMDGFELAEMIRRHPRCEKTSIILVSAICISDFDRLRGYGCGAVDYVPVPVVPDLLRAKVSVFADLYRKTQELSRLNVDLEHRVLDRTAELESSSALLRESEERLNLALDSAGAAPWDWEFGDARATWSPRFRGLYGFEEDEPASLETVLARVHPDDRERLSARVQRLLSCTDESDDLWNEEFRILHPTQGTRWLAGRGRMVRDAEGRPLRLTGIDLDITDRKSAEEDRARSLENEREARAAAEQANRLKDDFLATLSHELRTPINAVLGLVQLMKRGTLDSTDFAEGLKVIERGVHTQVRLIDELLDLNRINSGKLRMSEDDVNLSQVLTAAIDTVTPDATDKEIAILQTGDSMGVGLRGDATRLQQAFWNLLSNAIKFTPKGGKVELDVRNYGDQVQVTVTDTGLGIKPEFLPFVFDRFRQADSSTTRRHGGLGLGLAIAKYITEMHGGAIRAESNGVGHGARFTVTLPITSNRSIERDERNDDGQALDDFDLTGARILIVDDDDASREVVARMVSEYGAETKIAASAAEALQVFSVWPPDLMVCDIAMPVMDGYALIREVRSRPGGEAVPAIALTAYSRAEDRARALAAGYTAHIPKPIDPHILVQTLAKLARHPKLERQVPAV